MSKPLTVGQLAQVCVGLLARGLGEVPVVFEPLVGSEDSGLTVLFSYERVEGSSINDDLDMPTVFVVMG